MAEASETKETAPPRKKLVNANLISLKCLLFVFFGGLGCLYPFLPLHMEAVGLTKEELRIVSIVSPIVAILGPLLAGPLADRFAGRQGSNEKALTGRHLRLMITVTCAFSAVLYALLLLVPPVDRIDLPRERRPALKFSCGPSGATIYQERCRDSTRCHRWPEDSKVGAIVLNDCKYVCNSLAPKRKVVEPDMSTLDPNSLDWNTEYPDNFDGSGDIAVRPLEVVDSFPENSDQSEGGKKNRRYVTTEYLPPHMCYNDGKRQICHVYTKFSDDLRVNGTLGQANPETDREWCAYPIMEYFSCRIPQELESTMAEFNQTCSVKCELTESYDPGRIFEESQCQQVKGDPTLTFWAYLSIRSAADAFVTASVTLVDAAAVIATRETSCGRGDVGRQLAFGSLGFAIYGPLSGFLSTLFPVNSMLYIPIGLGSLLILLAAIVALLASEMPLSPPEWWWHTRSGMLALPMSAVKRYGSETAALFLVLVVLGVFWSAMNIYLPLHLTTLKIDELTIGAAMTAGALPAFIFLWKSEHYTDYLGHNQIFIFACTVYIVGFISLSVVPSPWWALMSEILQVFTLGITWVTAILYLRHLVPRHLTVTAQALPLIAHFCIGRCIGAAIGAYVDVGDGDGDGVYSTRFMYRCMAMASAIAAVLYFVVYHGILKPRCHAQSVQGPRQPPTIVQAMNGNGSYTPLRVYHNGLGKKGQFRY